MKRGSDETERADEWCLRSCGGDGLHTAKAILHDYQGSAAESRSIRFCGSRGIHRLGGENDQGRLSAEADARVYGRQMVAPRAAQADTMAGYRSKVFPACSHLDPVARPMQQCGDGAAD